MRYSLALPFALVLIVHAQSLMLSLAGQRLLQKDPTCKVFNTHPHTSSEMSAQQQATLFLLPAKLLPQRQVVGVCVRCLALYVSLSVCALYLLHTHKTGCCGCDTKSILFASASARSLDSQVSLQYSCSSCIGHHNYEPAPTQTHTLAGKLVNTPTF